MKQSSLCDIELNRSNVTERTLISICARFNANENWLRTGEGQMFNINDKKYEEFFSIYSKLNEPLQNFLIQCAENLIDAQKKL